MTDESRGWTMFAVIALTLLGETVAMPLSLLRYVIVQCCLFGLFSVCMVLLKRE